LADEAFSALDEITAASLRNDLLNLIGEEKKTAVFITHSVTEAAELAERILVFGKPGRVVSEISARDIQTNPGYSVVAEPPSTGRLTPFTKLASLLARNDITLATCGSGSLLPRPC
jgi:ABC-type nitrate/sulfonate/bicarbonate transport system ATPase subunit